MEEIQKQELTSMDIKEAQLQKLKELFPEAFTEGLKVDWDKLRLSLGDDTVDTGKERYGMNWPGKADCFKTIQQPSIATLIPARDESIDFDTTQNLFIEGDNLEVLKLLQKSYLSKIKVICIDPPYNTGNEFIYPDNYSENLNTYLEYTGQIDGEGRKFATNTETDGRFHSKWMNMMYPRLFLAKNLLREDGLIFISIDDNEAHNLRVICNEIFGEENFLADIVWQRTFATKNDAKYFSSEHENILVYSKNIQYVKINLLKRGEKQDARYNNPDNDSRGPWTSTDLLRMEHRVNSVYKITSPTGKEWVPLPGTSWRHPENEMLELIKNNEVTFGTDGNSKPRRKRFLSDVKQGIIPQTIWKHEEVGHTQEAKQMINKIFDNISLFDNPKPIRLIKRMVKLSCNKNDIVLDFFAGSATTAHAIMEHNKEEESNLNFICVQIPEPTEEKSEAYKAGYKTIADISKERIRRVATKMRKEEIELLKKSESKLFEEKRHVNDLGYKVYKLAQSNFKVWDTTVEKSPEIIQQKLFEHIQHISSEAQQEAILYELLLKSGFELTTPIEALTLAGKTVFSIADGQLLICLEKEITHDCIKAMAEKEPSRVICLDEAFTGTNADALKTNAVQIMKSKGVVNFRTV